MSKKPILYMHIYSPPARSVLLTGAELGIEFELRPVDLMNLEHKKPEFIKVNTAVFKSFSVQNVDEPEIQNRFRLD